MKTMPDPIKKHSEKTLVLLLGLVMLLLLTAVFAPVLAPHDPYLVNLPKKLLPMSSEYLLGTDHLGRDIFSRLIYGTRTSLAIILIIQSLIMAVSLCVGILAGYKGGIFDSVLMRITDLFLALPTFILGLFFIGVLGVGLVNVIVTIVLTHWAWYARLVRSIVLQIKSQDYILCAKTLGGSDFSIIKRHILPSVSAQILILATLDFGHMLLHVAGLSFLGLGIQAPTAEWGVMINDSLPYIYTDPWLMIIPGFCIFIVVAVFNSLGEILRDTVQKDFYPNDVNEFSEQQH